MNRRGFDVMSGETVRLLFGAVVLVALVFLVSSIIHLFDKGHASFSAKQNFLMLTKHIEYAVDHEIQPQESSVILSMPSRDYFFMGFDKDESQHSYTGRAESQLLRTLPIPLTLSIDITVQRPKQCNKYFGGQPACLCLMSKSDMIVKETNDNDVVIEFPVYECSTYGVETISGPTDYSVLTKVNNEDGKGSLHLIFSPEKNNVIVKTTAKSILIEQQ